MSLRKRFFITIVAILVGSFLVALTVAEVIFQDSFVTLENQQASRNVQRAVNALSIETSDLNVATQDWSNWDDTYKFAVDGGQDYIDKNFMDNIFENGKINLIIVLNKNKQIVHGKAYDLNKHQEIPIPPDLYQYLSMDVISEQGDTQAGVSGIILLKNGPFLISAHPILNSFMEGPSTGTLIFGKFIDSSIIDKFTETTYFPLSIWTANNTQIPDDFSKAKDSLSGTGAIYIRPIDRNTVAGYTWINDVFGKQAFILRVDVPRDIYKRGTETINFLLIALAGVCILLCLVSLFVMNKVFLSRLTVLSKNVNEIGRTGDTSLRVSSMGNDEITVLGNSVNNMLEKLGKTETELRTQKNLIDRIMANIPNIVIMIDEELNITLVNNTFCEVFKTNESDALGKPLSTFIPHQQILEITNRLDITNGPEHQFELMLKIDNVERILDTRIIWIEDQETLLIGRDITEERERQEKLYLTERLASIGEMAAGIAHEINNPLTGIIMLSQLLERSNIPDEVKKDVIDIKSEASRVADVVKNLLAFARKQPPSRQLTQINRIIEDVLRLRQYEQTVNNIEVRLDLAPDLPEIMVDNVQMQQVFLNLVLNAEYSMAQSDKQGRLLIASYVSDGKIAVSISDNGLGIKQENLMKIFQPFFTTKEVGKGTGLGLSLCYGIVKRHGGSISVLSELGKGAKFTVELPINAPEINGGENGE